MSAAGETTLSARTESDRGRTRRALSWLVLIAALYVALRLAAFVDVPPYASPDSATFKEVATKDIFSMSFLAGLRPWTTPLLYKLVTDDTARIWVQFVVSVLAWLVLAKTVAEMVSDRLRPFSFALVLLPSLAVQITLWDSTLLSESLAVSFTVLWMASWLRFLRDPTNLNVAIVLLVTLLWVFTRDTHGYVTVVVGVVVLVTLVRRGGRWQRAALGAGCVLIGCSSILSANQPYTVTLSRTAGGGAVKSSSVDVRQVGRWEFPLIIVIDRRVLTDPGRRAWFESRGMPVDPALMHFVGGEAATDNFAQFTSPHLSPFRRWLESDGQNAYYEYLLTHPGYLAEAFTTGSSLKAVAAPYVSPYQPDARRVLPQQVHDLVIPERQRAHGAVDKLLTGVGLALLLASFALGLLRLMRVPNDPVSYFVPGLLIALFAEILGVWHGDAGEVDRHAITAAVMLHAGAAVALVLGLDAYLARRRTAAQP